MSRDTSVVEAFGECLDALLDGQPVSDCLNRHDHFRDQLEPLLSVVAAAREAQYVPTWTPEKRAEARSAFLKHVAALTRDGVQSDDADSDLARG